MTEQGCYDVRCMDSNLRAMFDRVLQLLLDNNQDLELSEAKVIAGDMAAANLRTAKEVANAIASMRNGPTYCYLAFYGLGDTASFMKVGVSRHPERRMYGMATGNPLDCLWVYCLRAPASHIAFATEKNLLRHLKENKRRGEWLDVGKTDKEGANGLARQLSEVASIEGAEFIYMGDRHGH